MQTRSFSEGTPAADHSHVLPWYEVKLDWPYEKVVAELKIEGSRRPTLFEWALARILEEYGDDSSGNSLSLAEAADMLGIKEPVFLQETLAELIETGAVEMKNPALPVELSNARLTETGRQLLTEGRAACLPSRHGVHLYLDAITDEHLPKPPKNASPEPTNPVTDPHGLPERLDHIGLDRVRELCRLQGEPFDGAETDISEVTVHKQDGSFVWLPVCVAIGISHDGVVQARMESGTDARRDCFSRRGWDAAVLEQLASASTGSWANGRCRTRMQPVLAQKWLETVHYLVPPASTVALAHEMIGSAQEEVILHASWLDAAGVEDQLVDAAHRGVRCYLCGGELSLTHWSVSQGRTPGFVATVGSTETARPLVVLADRSRALCIDRVCARTPAGKEVTIEVASVPQTSALPALLEQLLASIGEYPAGQEVTHLFAKFALTENLGPWQQGLHAIRARTSGIEQVQELRQWGMWAKSLMPEDEPPNGWFDPAAQSWLAVFEAAGDGDSELLDLAVDLVWPAEILSHLVMKADPLSIWQNPGQFCEWVMLASQIQRRWPGFRPVQDCPRFAQALRTCLGPSDQHGIAEAVRLLSAQPQFQSEGSIWVGLVAGVIPPPHDPASFVDWLEAHEPLRDYLSEAFQKTAQQYVSQLQSQLRALRGDPILARVQQAWQALGFRAELLRSTSERDSHNLATPATSTGVHEQSR